MTTPRKHYSADFKAKVALEAIKGQKTLNELATEYGIHPNLVTTWKKQLQEQAASLFQIAGRRESEQKEAEELLPLLYQPGFHWSLIRSGNHHQHGRQGALLR